MKSLIKCISAPETKRGLCRLSAVVVASLMAGLAFDLQAAYAAKLIQLNAASTGRVFEGIGAVSARASTRLLPDYPEPQDLGRNWSLLGRINQKQTRPQDQPCALTALPEDDRALIRSVIPDLGA